MADPNAILRDVVRSHVSESAHRLTKRLSGLGHERKRATSGKRGKQSSRGKKRKKNIKIDTFS